MSGHEWYEEFKIISLYGAKRWTCLLLFSEAILDNHGSHSIGQHFLSDCEATLPSIFEFSQM